MIYNNDYTFTQVYGSLPKEYLEQLTEEGLESLPEMIRALVNQAMQIEQDMHLNAKPYERNDERSGHVNGYKPKLTGSDDFYSQAMKGNSGRVHTTRNQVKGAAVYFMTQSGKFG